MIEIVLVAFIGTHNTCFGAQRADIYSEFAAASHRCDRKPANGRAVYVQLDATRQHRDLGPSKGDVSTVVARQGTVIAALNTIRMVFQRHVVLLLQRPKSKILNARRDRCNRKFRLCGYYNGVGLEKAYVLPNPPAPGARNRVLKCRVRR